MVITSRDYCTIITYNPTSSIAVCHNIKCPFGMEYFVEKRISVLFCFRPLGIQCLSLQNLLGVRIYGNFNH